MRKEARDRNISRASLRASRFTLNRELEAISRELTQKKETLTLNDLLERESPGFSYGTSFLSETLP